jgi:hypothetical protein
LTFIAGSDPSGVLDMDRRPRADKATGALLWGFDLVVLGGEDGAEVWPVRVLGEPKGIRTGVPLRVGGLVAAPWEIDGRHGISFRARSIEAAKSSTVAAA